MNKKENRAEIYKLSILIKDGAVREHSEKYKPIEKKESFWFDFESAGERGLPSERRLLKEKLLRPETVYKKDWLGFCSWSIYCRAEDIEKARGLLRGAVYDQVKANYEKARILKEAWECYEEHGDKSPNWKSPRGE